ncbi:MAG TPA: hypothetical protein VFU46_01080 [Gemmatimonadales bacterium]|nr:hypothetical protein [Gemmatimonadales bacterium]
MRATLHGALLALSLAACAGGDRAAGAPCGIAAIAGPTALLTQFSVPRQTLSAPPRQLPEQLPVRLVAGPAYRGIVGRSDSLWIVGVEGPLPEGTRPGFGVLVLDTLGAARGVMLFEGSPVEGAPPIGSVSVGSATVPLIGIQLDPARIEDPRCPFFPDSVIR